MTASVIYCCKKCRF